MRQIIETLFPRVTTHVDGAEHPLMSAVLWIAIAAAAYACLVVAP